LTFKTSLKTDRIHDNIHGVKLTPAFHRRYKIGLPVEGLITRGRMHNNIVTLLPN